MAPPPVLVFLVLSVRSAVPSHSAAQASASAVDGSRIDTYDALSQKVNLWSAAMRRDRDYATRAWSYLQQALSAADFMTLRYGYARRL